MGEAVTRHSLRPLISGGTRLKHHSQVFACEKAQPCRNAVCRAAGRIGRMQPRACGERRLRITGLAQESIRRMYVDRTTPPPPAQPMGDGLPWEKRRWAIAAIFTALAM